MTNQVIPAEAVEAAAKAIDRADRTPLGPNEPSWAHFIARKALEAAFEALFSEVSVDRIARALNNQFPYQWEKMPAWAQEDERRQVRATLEAAAPYMLKSAYDLGFQHGSNEPANPYRSAK